MCVCTLQLCGPVCLHQGALLDQMFSSGELTSLFTSCPLYTSHSHLFESQLMANDPSLFLFKLFSQRLSSSHVAQDC